MNYHKHNCYKPKPVHCHMEDHCEMPCMKEHMDNECPNMCADLHKMKCKVEKECIKTYKTYYKLYRVCEFRLYKCCPCCGHEFDYHSHRGTCPKCGVSM